jgi:hypothetical protein
VPWRTYTALTQEYAAFVTWLAECHVKAQVSYLHLLLDLGQLPENSIKIDHIQYQSWPR